MDIDESQIDEQIEISALNTDNLEKLQNILQKVLIKQPDSNAFNIDADNRYADFAECISKMQGKTKSLIRDGAKCFIVRGAGGRHQGGKADPEIRFFPLGGRSSAG